MAEQDFSEIARLSERYSKNPKSRIFVQLADAYRKNNMIDEAFDILNQGLKYHPDYSLAYLILGKCYYDKRELIQAKEAFEKTIEFDPQNIVALRMLAQICETLKDDAGQLRAYKSIIELDPFDGQANEKLGLLESRVKKTEPLFTLTLAQEYETQGNYAQALKVYEHLLYSYPTDLVLKTKVEELKKKLEGTEKPEGLAGIVEQAPALEVPLVSEPGAEVMPVEDFLMAQPKLEQTEPVTPATQGIEQAPAVEQLPIIEPVEEERRPEPQAKVLSWEDLLVEEPVEEKPAEPTKQVIEEAVELTPGIELPKEEPLAEIEEVAAAKAEEPVVLEPFEERPAELRAEVLANEKVSGDLTIEEGIVVQPEEKEEETILEPLREEKPGPIQELPEGQKEAITPEPKKEEEPISPEPEEKKEEKEPAKPKDEDFKSFQEWLSNLLK